jgi:hypothetical protein
MTIYIWIQAAGFRAFKESTRKERYLLVFRRLPVPSPMAHGAQML